MTAESPIIGFEPFRIIRQRQREWQDTLNNEIGRRKGTRKRVDIPLGVAIENERRRQRQGVIPYIPTTDPDTLSRLRHIINGDTD